MNTYSNELTVIGTAYASGVAVGEIARELGISRNAVIGKAWRAGFIHPRGCVGGREWYETRNRELAGCVVNGATIRDMADRYGRDEHHVRKIVRKYCLCVRNGGNSGWPSRWRWRDEQRPAP